MSATRALRAVLSAALIALASGIPHVVLAALDGDRCAVPCGRDLDGRCPPNCTQGACSKSVSSTALPCSRVEAPPPGWTEAAPAEGAVPALPLVTRGVFHPPRR